MTLVEKKILTFLGGHPERAFYTQEVAKSTRCSKASASGILVAFSKKNIVFRDVRGHMKFYRINPKHVEVKRWKIDVALNALRRLTAQMARYAQTIILFGSASRGEQTFNSDIDVFVLTNNKPEVQRIITKSRRRVKINVITKTPSEWAAMEVREPEFYQQIKSGITIHTHVPRI